MQKKFLILIVFAILLTACEIKATPTVNTPTTSPEPSATDVAQREEPTEESVVEPTFNPYISVPLEELTQSVPMPLPEPRNKEFMSPVDGEEEGIYFVESNPSEMTLRNDRLPEVGFPVELNGTEADKVGAVVIEFNLEGTVAPLDNTYFGYDYGAFVGMYNSRTITNAPAWNDNGPGPGDTFLERFGAEIDLEMMLEYHELALNMQKYLQLDGNHYKYIIPYSEWQNAAKYLCVQFAPETTFSNLSISVLVKEGVDPDIVDKITKPIEKSPDGSVLDEIPSEFWYPDSYETQSPVLDKVYGEPLMNAGLVINPDGSISMPKSFHDFGEYADEVKGDYAVFPEGYVSVFMTLGAFPELFNNEQVRQVSDFMFEYMIDENGQISGIYDIEQGKMVATDRKVPALPILSAMLMRADFLTPDEIIRLLDSIIANDIVRVDDTLYYAPNGISDAGVMDFKLSDFAISNQLFHILVVCSNNGALDDPSGIAILMEGYNNSLKLILEGQEQNATKLPSSELKVSFLEDGGYELQPSETFDINDSFFTMWLLSYSPFDQFPGQFPFIEKVGNSSAWKNSLKSSQDGSYSARQEETIREKTAMYSEVYNAYDSINTFYEICFNIKGFIDVQPVSTRYAPAYNVNTGEPIYAEPGTIASNLPEMTAIAKRFGRPGGILNYLNIVGMTNDEAKVKETAALLLSVYDLYLNWVFMASNLDYTDPDLFAENFFYIWGGDSLKPLIGGVLTPTFPTRFLYSTSGQSLNREDFKNWMLRALNENRAEDNKLTPDDVIPLFYDHIPGAIIVETED